MNSSHAMAYELISSTILWSHQPHNRFRTPVTNILPKNIFTINHLNTVCLHSHAYTRTIYPCLVSEKIREREREKKETPTNYVTPFLSDPYVQSKSCLKALNWSRIEDSVLLGPSDKNQNFLPKFTNGNPEKYSL
jgi:hypothetical protein